MILRYELLNCEETCQSGWLNLFIFMLNHHNKNISVYPWRFNRFWYRAEYLIPSSPNLSKLCNLKKKICLLHSLWSYMLINDYPKEFSEFSDIFCVCRHHSSSDEYWTKILQYHREFKVMIETLLWTDTGFTFDLNSVIIFHLLTILTCQCLVYFLSICSRATSSKRIKWFNT